MDYKLTLNGYRMNLIIKSLECSIMICDMSIRDASSIGAKADHAERKKAYQITLNEFKRCKADQNIC